MSDIIRSRHGARLAAVAVLLASTLALGAPAQAYSGSFTWSATFKLGLDSRAWTQVNSGSVKIKTSVDCNGAYLSDKYRVSLYRGSSLVSSSQWYSCGTVWYTTWSSQPPGTYHFRLDKANNGEYFTASGYVQYP